MAHQLTKRESGMYEFAFTGNRSAIWHGLGQELTPDASIEQWKTEAGLDWEIFESQVQYNAFDLTGMKTHNFPEKKVLFRSDTKAGLSVVGADYHVVQPGQVLEFFRDLVSFNGFKLSAAGSLFGGKRFWATADVGKTTNAVSDDSVGGQLLLVSSADGSTSTVAKFTSTRTVCNNTLTVALNDGKNAVKKSHRSIFNERDVKIDLGVLDEGWDTFSSNIKKLAELEVSDKFVMDYLKGKFYVGNGTADEQTWGAIKKVNTLFALYKNGTGASYSNGTAWGVVNAVTEMYTHGTKESQDPSRRFWESAFGAGDKMKSEVYNDMIELMA